MNPAITSLIVLLIAIAFLIVFSFRGWSVPVLAVIASAFIFFFERMITGDTTGFTALMKDTFMSGFVSFTKGYFLLIFLSSIFAAFMSDSGAAHAIAKAGANMASRFPGKEKFVAVLSVVAVSAILCAGGISAFVIVFVVMPIAKNLFEELDVPWHLVFIFCAGAGTFGLSMPGTPSVNNIIASTHLGTTPSAGLALGIIATAVMIVLDVLYTRYAVNKTIRANEGFMPTGSVIKSTTFEGREYVQNIKVWQALIPIIVVLVSLNGFKLPAELAMVLGCVVCYAMFFKNLPSVFKKTVSNGGMQAMGAVISTSAIVGFGAAAASTLGYQLVVENLLAWNLPPVWKVVIAINILSALLGSSSGALTLGFEQLAKPLMATGLNPAVIHRIATTASISLDSLPHCSAVVLSLQTFRLTHKQAYKHCFVVQTMIPLIATIIAALFAMAGVV